MLEIIFIKVALSSSLTPDISSFLYILVVISFMFSSFKVDEISLLITSILFLSKTNPLDNSSVKSLNLLGPIIENTEDAPAKISAIIINGIKLFK